MSNAKSRSKSRSSAGRKLSLQAIAFRIAKHASKTQMAEALCRAVLSSGKINLDATVR